MRLVQNFLIQTWYRKLGIKVLERPQKVEGILGGQA